MCQAHAACFCGEQHGAQRHDVLCSVTWERGEEFECWEWSYDEVFDEYISEDDDSVLNRENLIFLYVEKELEGWTAK